MNVVATELAIGYEDNFVAESISFSLQKGESLLVIGHNGSGKSTLLKTLFGLLRPLKGSGVILGESLAKAHPRELLLRGVRYLGQGDRCFDHMPVSEYGATLSRLYGLATVEEPFAFTTKVRTVGELSLGQRKLAAVNLLSAGKPLLFLMDEPTAGMDPHHVNHLREWIEYSKGLGVSFIIVEQRFRDFIEILETTLVFRGGGVSFWGPSVRISDEKKLAEVFL